MLAESRGNSVLPVSVAVISCGARGSRLVKRLRARGVQVASYDFDPAVHPALQIMGSSVVGSAAEAARGAEFVITALLIQRQWMQR